MFEDFVWTAMFVQRIGMKWTRRRTWYRVIMNVLAYLKYVREKFSFSLSISTNIDQKSRISSMNECKRFAALHRCQQTSFRRHLVVGTKKAGKRLGPSSPSPSLNTDEVLNMPLENIVTPPFNIFQSLIVLPVCVFLSDLRFKLLSRFFFFSFIYL